MLHLDWLRTFVAVVEAGSYTMAADRLGVSQPAVSKHMQHLEESFGTELKTWRGRILVLTDAGNDVLTYARRTLGELDRLTEDIESSARERVQTVIVASGPTYLYHYIPVLVETMRSAASEIRLSTLTILPQEDLTLAVMEGRADIALHTSRYSHPSLVRTPVLSDQLVVVANPRHAFANVSSVSAEDFARARIQILSRGAESRLLVEDWLATRGLSLDDPNHLGSLPEIRATVLATPAVGVTSRISIMDALAAGRLVEVRVNGFGIARTIYASSRLHPSAATARVLALMAEAFESTVSRSTEPSPA